MKLISTRSRLWRRSLFFLCLLGSAGCKTSVQTAVGLKEQNSGTLVKLTFEGKPGQGVQTISGHPTQEICVSSGAPGTLPGVPVSQAENDRLLAMAGEQAGVAVEVARDDGANQANGLALEGRDDSPMPPKTPLPATSKAPTNLPEDKSQANRPDDAKVPDEPKAPANPPTPAAAPNLPDCSPENSSNCRIAGFKMARFDMNVVDTYEQVARQFSFSADGGVKYGIVSAEGIATFNEVRQATNNSKYLIVKATVGGGGKILSADKRYLRRRFYEQLLDKDGRLPKPKEPTNADPYPEDPEFMEKIRGFYNACGDRFVESISTGSTFLAVGVISIERGESTRDFMAKLSAAASGFGRLQDGKLSAEARLKLDALNKMSSGQFSVTSSGAGIAPQSKSFEEMFTELNAWYARLAADSNDPTALAGDVIAYKTMTYAGLLIEPTAEQRSGEVPAETMGNIFANIDTRLTKKLNNALANVVRARQLMIALNQRRDDSKKDLSDRLSAYEHDTSIAVKRCLENRYSEDCLSKKLTELPPGIPAGQIASEGAILDAINKGLRFKASVVNPTNNRTYCLATSQSAGVDPPGHNLYFSPDCTNHAARLFTYNKATRQLHSSLFPGECLRVDSAAPLVMMTVSSVSDCSNRPAHGFRFEPSGESTFKIMSYAGQNLCVDLNYQRSATYAGDKSGWTMYLLKCHDGVNQQVYIDIDANDSTD